MSITLHAGRRIGAVAHPGCGFPVVAGYRGTLDGNTAIVVPARPSSASAASLSAPMTAVPPRSANRVAASTFGSMLPRPKAPVSAQHSALHGRQSIEASGAVRAEALVDGIDVGQQQKAFGLDRRREHDCGEILVHHCLDSARSPLLVQHDRHPATAAGHDEEALPGEAAHGRRFE